MYKATTVEKQILQHTDPYFHLFQFILLFTFIDFKRSSYGDYTFPIWADVLGWIIAILEIAFIPGVAIYKICTIETDRPLTLLQVRPVLHTLIVTPTWTCTRSITYIGHILVKYTCTFGFFFFCFNVSYQICYSSKTNTYLCTVHVPVIIHSMQQG